MIRTLTIIGLASALAACQPAAQKPAEAPAQEAPAAAPAPEVTLGWSVGDDAGLPKVTYRASAEATEFSMICGDEQQALYVAAASPEPVTEASQKVTLILGDKRFDGNVEDAAPGLEVFVKLSPQLMKALGAAAGAKLQVGKSVTATDELGGPTLKDFAARCVTATNVQPAP